MTDDQIREIWLRETGYAEEAAPFAILDFARAILATTAPAVEKEASGDALKAHAIDCTYITDDNPWAKCTCGFGRPSMIEISASPTVGDSAGDPQVNRAIYQVWVEETSSYADVTPEYYAERLPSNRRIVYARPPAQTADVRAMTNSEITSIWRSLRVPYDYRNSDIITFARALLEQKP